MDKYAGIGGLGTQTWRRHGLCLLLKLGKGRAETGTGNKRKGAYSDTAACSFAQVYIKDGKHSRLTRTFSPRKDYHNQQR
jgi:hypothetical protein